MAKTTDGDGTESGTDRDAPADTTRQPRIVLRLSPPDQEKRVFAELREVARRFREGDESVLRRRRPFVSTKTAGRGLEPSFGDCGAALPYLASRGDDGNPVFDRIQWFTASAPPTGFISNQFECEFNRPILTIVGGGLDRNSNDAFPFVGFDSLSWDGFASPGDVPGIQFTVRVQHFLPGQDSQLQLLNLNRTTSTDPGLRPRRVLVNVGVPDPGPGGFPPGQFRSSLVFEFHVPQRAVGIEFGYRPLESLGNRQPSAVGVQLYAYDTRGRLITSSDAGRVGGRVREGDLPLLEPDSVAHRVGVRAAGGDISSVELRFEGIHAHDPGGERIVEEQVVYRIWHESLPPAAVLQGAVASEFGPGLPSRPQPTRVDLPFQFDRAVVFMRGFKIEFLDGQAHNFESVGARITKPDRSPAVYYSGPGGRIEFVADSDPTWSNATFRRRVTAFFSVLAWDSRQMDLYAFPVQTYERTEDSDLHRTTGFSYPLEQAYGGPVFGALQGCEFIFDRDQPINHVWLSAGVFGGGPCQFEFSSNWLDDGVPSIESFPPRLDRSFSGATGGLIDVRWEICSQMSGDDEDEHQRSVEGTVIWGGSLVHPGFPLITTGDLPFRGPRPDGDTFFAAATWEPSGQVPEADMIAFGLREFFLAPDDDVQQLEVEVRARQYDGTNLRWELGGGMSVSGPITAEPAAAALIRRSRFQRGELVVQDLLFDGVEGLVSHPDQSGYGAVRNVGSAVVLLNDLQTDTAGSRFDYRFLFQNRSFNATSLLRALPLPLQPGEVLWIGGLYKPQGVAGDLSANPPIPPDQGSLVFRTNSPRQPTATVRAFGVAHRAQPQGSWYLLSVDFGEVSTDSTKSAVDVLFSTGPTPLLVNGGAFEHGDRGFEFREALVQEDGYTVIIRYTERRRPPENAQPITDRFIADTNAGPIPLPVSAGRV